MYLCIGANGPSVRLVHRRGPPDDRTERLLASDVDVARSRFAQARGLMFRRSIPEEYALVFPFDGVETRTLHMLFVPFAIDAIWLVDDEVTATARLSPFVGIGRGDADTVVELPAGGADAVAVGDAVVVSGDEA
jgi:uncharacterized membrane protein (UPF0127 family)